MRITLLGETVLAMLGAAMPWEMCRLGHRAAESDQSEHYCLITVPSWLSTICGRPLSDNRLEIGYMLCQIGSLVMGISWLPMAWLGLDHSHRLVIYSGICVGTVIVSVAARLIARLIRLIVRLSNRLR
jgi:hypothetical protein